MHVFVTTKKLFKKLLCMGTGP